MLLVPAAVYGDIVTSPIVEDEVFSRTHGGEEVLRYSFDATHAGTYLVEVAQRGPDLSIAIRDSDSIPKTFDSPTKRYDRETVLLEPARKGQRFTIELVSDEFTGAAGTHSISVSKIEEGVAVTAYRYITDAAAANHLGGENNWEASLSQYAYALAIFRELGDEEQQARLLMSIANLHYWRFASWLVSAETAEKAASIYADMGNSELYANAMYLQAAALIEAALVSSSDPNSTTDAQTLFDNALQLFGRSLRIQRSIGDEYGGARTLNNIGLTYYYMDDWSEATGYFEKAAAQFRNQKEWSDELNPLANLAIIDFEVGRFAQAVESLDRLLELIPGDKEPAWRADTLDNLGASLLALGQLDGALQSFFEALELHEGAESTKGQGRSLTGIGSTYYSIGEMELAQVYFERALPIREQANDGRGQVAVLHFLGDIHRRLGHYELALDYHTRALNLAVTPIARAKIEILRARDQIDAGNYRIAEEILRRVNDATRHAYSGSVVADASYELGRTLARLGDAERAQSELESALVLYEEIGSKDGQARSLLELARTRQATDPDGAIHDAHQAIVRIEQLRSRVANPELRAVYLGTRRIYYEFLIDALMHAHDVAGTESRAQSYLREALSVAERGRARATVDLMNEAAVDLHQGVDPALRERQYELYAKLAEKQFLRDQILEQGAYQEGLNAAVSELQDIHTALDVLEIQLRESNPRLVMLGGAKVLDTRRLQDELDDESVALQYWLGESASYLWIVSRSDIRAVRMADRGTIDHLTKQVYQSLAGFDSAPGRTREAALESLSKLVLVPAAEAIANKHRVILAADGSLQYVPFSLLSADGQTSIIQSHEIVVVPSITAISAHRQAFASRPRAPTKTLAAIGDPVFQLSDPRVSRSVNHTPSFGEAVPASFLGLFDTQSDLARLPFSAMEIERIASLVADKERLVFTGFDATREKILQGAVADYRFIHFGTHGLINARHPALSTLVFSLVDESGRPRNGLLRLHDVYNLDLTADLVVLSGCETGLGRDIRGEGLVGLTQGFMYAGAKSVIATLWRVSDRATAELMTRFYEYLLEDGNPPARALRRAQLDMAAQRRWRDPYFWSGFVLHGDWM